MTLIFSKQNQGLKIRTSRNSIKTVSDQRKRSIPTFSQNVIKSVSNSIEMGENLKKLFLLSIGKTLFFKQLSFIINFTFLDFLDQVEMRTYEFMKIRE